MPIEFPCSQCGKLLRVGDEAAGKQAQCPSCGAVQGIPSSQTQATPFGAMSSMTPSHGTETNPYQAPIQLGIEAPTAPLRSGPRPIRPTIISLSEPIKAAWQICKENVLVLLMCVVAMVICVGINYASQIAGQAVISIFASVRPPAALMIATGIVVFVAAFVFQTWMQIGQTLFFLKTARGEEASLGILFAGGPYLISTLLATLVMVAVVLCVLAVCAALGLGAYAATKEPAAGFIVGFPPFIIANAYLILTYGASAFLIADQGLGPLESLQVSSQITAGNRLTLFALAALAFVAAVGSVLLCCLPYLVMVPFIVLTATITYLKMAGQVTADEALSDRQTATPFASQSSELP